MSLFIAKICGFVGSVFIIRLLPANEYGTVSIVASVFYLFLSFSGFGSNQILLRYGSVTQDFSEKENLSRYLLRSGFVYQMLLSILFLLISLFYINKYQDILFIFVLFTVRLSGFYFLNHIQAEFRIRGDNRSFAQVSNVVNIAGVILLLTFAYFFGLTGYLCAIALTPFLSLLWFRRRHFNKLAGTFTFPRKELWSFGLHAAGTALLSDTLMSADVLMLSYMMNESAVASYKVGLILPLNITFLASTFMQSDYPVLAKNSSSRNFLKNYILNYYKIFIPLSVLIFGSGYLFRDEIIGLLFGARYADSSGIFVIFLAGFSLNMLLRNLYGNLLSAVGRMRFNTFISALNIVLLFAFAFIFVKNLGAEGMAWSLAGSMLICGILLLLSFYRYWERLN